jgi:hypothetical protein
MGLHQTAYYYAVMLGAPACLGEMLCGICLCIPCGGLCWRRCRLVCAGDCWARGKAIVLPRRLRIEPIVFEVCHGMLIPGPVAREQQEGEVVFG